MLMTFFARCRTRINAQEKPLSLKWTYAYAEGKPTHIAKAVKGVSYSHDREGRVPMVLRWGEVNCKHFALSSKVSLGETELHQYCKKLFADLLRQGEHLKGNIRFWVQCSCGTWHRIMSFPDHNQVHVEARLPNGLVPDVLLSLEDEACFGFEIRHRHAVDEDKRGRYGIPYFEFDATDFVQFSDSLPHNVLALTTCDTLSLCERCEVNRRFVVGLKKIAAPVAIVGGMFLLAAVLSELFPEE